MNTCTHLKVAHEEAILLLVNKLTETVFQARTPEHGLYGPQENAEVSCLILSFGNKIVCWAAAASEEKVFVTLSPRGSDCGQNCFQAVRNTPLPLAGTACFWDWGIGLYVGDAFCVALVQ